jgi:hypothetical protein
MSREMEPRNAPQESQNVEIIGSNLNYYGLATIKTTLMPIDQLMQSMEKTDYDGMEYNHLSLPWTQAEKLTKDQLTFIKFLKQSYRQEKTFGEAWNHPNKFLALQSYFVMPESEASLFALENLQQDAGNIPIILESVDTKEKIARHNFTGEKLLQPHARLLERYNITTLQELKDKAIELGYTGYCLDPFLWDQPHANREGNITYLPNLINSLDDIIDFVKVFHASAGRLDIRLDSNYKTLQKQIDESTMNDLNWIITKKGESNLKHISLALKEKGYRNPVVIQATANSLVLHRQLQQKGYGKRIKKEDLEYDHKNMVNTMRQIFN